VIGRPILYKTTKEFLLRFGLKDVNDLPSMEEFEKMAGELAESEAAGEAQDAIMQSSDQHFGGEASASVPAESAGDETDHPEAGSGAESEGAQQELTSTGVAGEP
jgi:segregation and condensation protein B